MSVDEDLALDGLTGIVGLPAFGIAVDDARAPSRGSAGAFLNHHMDGTPADGETNAPIPVGKERG